MLIGIDMMAVQSPEGSRRGSARYGRQLVSGLLAGDQSHRYVLYAHEGMPTDRLPWAGQATRVSLAPKAGGAARLRPTIQRAIDRNPDGLDWLLLLDPFEPNYGGIPPEVPVDSGLRVASLVHDLGPCSGDDRRLDPLRRHDAILAVSEATAADCRGRLGPASGRVTTLGLASEFLARPGGPPSRLEALDLGRVGITGPFLLANASMGGDRDDLGVILDAYRRLPVGVRGRVQLAVAGHVDDPWGVVGSLQEHGCAEGLVLVGEVDERTWRTLCGRCAALVSPTIGGGSGLAIVEAMCSGAALVGARAGDLPDVFEAQGPRVDPSGPVEIAEQLVELLTVEDPGRASRERARARPTGFGWGPVVATLLGRLSRAEPPPPRARFRLDRPRSSRPRVALFADHAGDGSAVVGLAARVADGWRAACDVDVYSEPGADDRVDPRPADRVGLDARRFDREDGLLSYDAVVYHFPDVRSLELRLGRLRVRPGLVFPPDEVDAPGDEGPWGLLREVFLTSSRVVVGSGRQADRIKASLPEFVDQLVEVGPGGDLAPDAWRAEIERCAAELGRRPAAGRLPVADRPRESPATSKSVPRDLGLVPNG